MLGPGAARSTDVRAEVREAGEVVGLIAGGDADEVHEVEGARVLGRGVVVDAVAVVVAVAGGRDEQDLRVPPDRLAQDLGEGGADEARVHDPRALGRRVVERAHDRAVADDAVGVGDPQRHQADLPAHAGGADAVVAARAGDARDVSAVAVDVLRVVVAVDEVPAAPVVDEAVAVVVATVGLLAAAVLTRVSPQVRSEVGVVVGEPRVGDRHQRRGPAGRDGPGIGRVDVGVRRARRSLHRLAGVREPPQLAEAGIVARSPRAGSGSSAARRAPRASARARARPRARTRRARRRTSLGRRRRRAMCSPAPPSATASPRGHPGPRRPGTARSPRRARSVRSPARRAAAAPAAPARS